MTETSNPPLSNLNGKRVLVTGATGFLGQHLTQRLLAEGAQVHATSRSKRLVDGSERNPAQGEPADPLQWHQLDLSRFGDIERLMSRLKPQVVFHLASLVTGSRDRRLVRPSFQANLETTVYLLDAAATSRVERFVQVGSLEESPLDEPPAVPASPYAAAKAAATAYSRMYAELYEVPVTIARVFMVYGPGAQDLNKIVPYTILGLLRGDELSFSSGTRAVDWIYIGDVVEGLMRMATAADVVGQQIDLGTGRDTTIADLVKTLYRLSGSEAQPPLGARPDRPLEQVRLARVQATEAALGWRPEVSLEEGLKRTLSWFQSALQDGSIR